MPMACVSPQDASGVIQLQLLEKMTQKPNYPTSVYPAAEALGCKAWKLRPVGGKVMRLRLPKPTHRISTNAPLVTDYLATWFFKS